jgi:predicted acyl esterase
VYVPVGDGVRLAVDVWLPVERTAVGGAVGTVMRVTRYHRAEAPREPGPEVDTNAGAGDLFNGAGFALVVVDARGTGASFGTRTGELGEREIKDYGELIGWIAAQPWSNPRETRKHEVDVTASTGAMNRWLAIDLGRAPAYPDRKHADDSLLTFTSGPLPADVHVLGFPVVMLRLATSGTDGAVYVYLEDVDPDGHVSYLTEGCLRFLHRKTTGTAEPVRLGVPRTFARSDALRVVPGKPMGLTVQLLPVSAAVPARHRLRVAIAGHDASSFTRYGPAEETFTLRLGSTSHLDLPVRYG